MQILLLPENEKLQYVSPDVGRLVENQGKTLQKGLPHVVRSEQVHSVDAHACQRKSVFLFLLQVEMV